MLGFSNRWYPTAIDTAETFYIAGHDARVVTPALFIATKLEAFHGRAVGDIVARSLRHRRTFAATSRHDKLGQDR